MSRRNASVCAVSVMVSIHSTQTDHFPQAWRLFNHPAEHVFYTSNSVTRRPPPPFSLGTEAKKGTKHGRWGGANFAFLWLVEGIATQWSWEMNLTYWQNDRWQGKRQLLWAKSWQRNFVQLTLRKTTRDWTQTSVVVGRRFTFWEYSTAMFTVDNKNILADFYTR
jgi:hypothetical protein